MPPVPTPASLLIRLQDTVLVPDPQLYLLRGLLVRGHVGNPQGHVGCPRADQLPNLSENTRTRRIRHASVRRILRADWLGLDS